VQFPIFGVTITFEVIAAVELLAAVKVMFPEPELLFNPVVVLSFVQSYVTAEFVAKFVVNVSPLHTVSFDTVTVGVGFTVTVRVSVLVQVQTLSGTVISKIYRTSIGEGVLLVSVSVMGPGPFWAETAPVPAEEPTPDGNVPRDHLKVVFEIALVAV
jgi:hypothetical protein